MVNPSQSELIQGNVKQDDKWDQNKVRKILKKYEKIN